MKKRFLLVVLLPFFAFSQSDRKTCETLSRINSLLQELHYRPKTLDDSLSVYVFNHFLEALDEDNRIFIAPEIKSFKKHQYKIDDYIRENDCAFINELFVTYNNAIQRYDRIIETLKKESFPYSSTEKIHFSKEAFPYAESETELKQLYKKSALFNVLKEVSEISKNKDSLQLHFESLAARSKVKTLEGYSCKSAQYQLTATEFSAKLYSVFCSYFDPHTEYFSEEERSSFLSNVSADNLTFGMYVSMNDKDEVIVEEIIPGSSAYFTQKIDVGDQVTKIQANGQVYEIACSSMKKVDEIIHAANYKQAEFTLRKKTGETYTVELVKKVMKDSENNVYSYVIEKDDVKAGYIRVPSFYGQFENGKTNVSEDLAKEIFKLQENKIDGLIIDLENNGGGSMEEAIKMAGLFIDMGPLAIMDNSRHDREFIKDPNRGTLYTGPMVVLINGFSASASEFFANAMQDYNRAIIVGNQSFGKASMQQIFPLTREKKPTEFLKITLEKFYRITGKSNQTIGITPDVEIPLLFDRQMPRENASAMALKSDEIPAASKFSVLQNELREVAIEKSKSRIRQNQTLQSVVDLNTKIDLLYENALPPILLQFSAVFDEVNKVNKLWEEIKTLSEIESPLKVERNKIDTEYQQFDDYLKSSNIEKIKAIKTNNHIYEAANIINDLKMK